MSRLEDLANRLLTQRAALNRAVELIEPMEGIVVELGLGKGRSFDHLRERLPGREIYVFDRELSCEPEYAPPDEFRVFGEITRTLPAFCRQFAGQAVLVHSDLGTRHRERDMPLVEFVAENLDSLLKQGAVVASDRPMENAPWIRLPELREMECFPYYMYRKHGCRQRGRAG